MDKLKLKSYALLMAYDLPKIFEKHSDFLKEYGEKGLAPSNEQILLIFIHGHQTGMRSVKI